MVHKLTKGSVYLLALVTAAVFSLFTGNKGVSNYILSHKNSGGIPTALAEVPVGGSSISVPYGAGEPGGDSSGSAGCGSSADSSGGGGIGSCDGAGGGGGGSKVICTELYRQGLMSECMWRADEEFGRLVSMIDPDVMLGYHAWAPPVVRLMRESSLVTAVVAAVALPWAKEMAYQMDVAPVGSKFGNIVMHFGLSSCRMIGGVVRAMHLVPERIV